MSFAELIEEYAAGPAMLRNAVEGMTPDELQARPVPGKWSTLQVVCHIADFEPVYADRIKRVLAEDQPLMPSGDPDLFAARLRYDQRDVEEELQLVAAVRAQLTRILKTLEPADTQRTGRHSVDGLLTLETLLRRITSHVSHHVKFIDEKRRALAGATGA